MRRSWERAYPSVVAVLFAGVYLAIPSLRERPLPASFTSLLAAVISVSGIAVGFLATAKSILVSIDDKAIIKHLKKINRYREILAYIRKAIGWSFLLAVFSAIGLLFDLAGKPSWTFQASLLFAGWLFVATAATLASYRVISVFYKILDSLE